MRMVLVYQVLRCLCSLCTPIQMAGQGQDGPALPISLANKAAAAGPSPAQLREGGTGVGQDAVLEPFSQLLLGLTLQNILSACSVSICVLGLFICLFFHFYAGICSALKLTVPSHTIHGIEGQPLHLTVDYNFNTTASEIQIIWLFERPQSNPTYLLGSVNQTVVPDLEYQHKFTLVPPNASLMINPLRISDEGNYIVKVNVRGNGTIAASQKIRVAVDGKFIKSALPLPPETMEEGPLTSAGDPGPTYTFSSNNATLLIVPVVKEDVGNYSCLVSNPVSAMESEIIAPTIYYGPYGVRVKSDKGLNIGAVFTVDMGEVILFDCSADSNPPNTYSWVQKADNATQVIQHGPHLEVVSDKVAQKTIDYVCRAFNNATGKRDETHFTVVVTSAGKNINSWL
ncbi:hypothetical protein llap_12217 [Limosa lapponica baueri]|uniref:Ig-like domain-containing protein n=1 Tax=Limosa lapponica baueri TaxID=1758121 RepID=A0A2I0TUN1_LIMLA|nr:hypothetical protein llap_12217 [Limosa lapponica baueri]